MKEIGKSQQQWKIMEMKRKRYWYHSLYFIMTRIRTYSQQRIVLAECMYIICVNVKLGKRVTPK
jgi:hypothetical protein